MNLVVFGIRFRRLENNEGFHAVWEIQPDGRYWMDEDGFGMENSIELSLYTDLDNEGIYK